MSRGSLLLRCTRENRELSYAVLARSQGEGAKRHSNFRDVPLGLSSRYQAFPV